MNDCDPYCNSFTDDPCGGLDAGGFVTPDCGLSIAPNDAAPDAAGAGAYQGLPGGNNTCTGGGTNVGPGNACS